jgi:hypothetical protein
MRPCRTMKDRFLVKLVIGLGLIALGTIFSLQNLGLFPWGGTIHFWPLTLLFLALFNFAKRGLLSFGAHLFLLGGAALQLQSLGHGAFLDHWWPVSLIWLGALIALRSLRLRRPALLTAPCQHAYERPS